jgi:cobalt-zinc-cadmium efflux system membrane fusion protein
MRRSLACAATSITVAAILSTISCTPSKPAAAAETSAPPADAQATLFQVPQNQIAQLKIADVKRSTWASVIHTTGTVDWDADHTTQAITQVNGPISKLLVDLGSVVAADQPLLYVASPDVANAVATYRKARNHQDYAKKTLDRSKNLLDHQVIAVKDLEAAEQDYNDATSDVESSLQALKIFGITQQEIDDAQHQGAAMNTQLAVRSPIAGVVVQKLVSPGLVIQAGMTVCFMISDVSTVWTQGHIYDRDLDSIHVGDTVEQTNNAFKETFQGTVSYIGALIDPATRTTSIRIVTKNPKGLLKKDMFLDAVIHTRTARTVLSVPTSAILRNEENLPFVYVQVSAGQFGQRLVTLGAQQGDDTEIASGLKEGEKIVAEGSVFLQFENSTR